VCLTQTIVYEMYCQFVYQGNRAHLDDVLRNPTRQSVSLCVYILALQGKFSVKYLPLFVPAATNTYEERCISGRVIFHAVRYLSKETL
jgi:hypothetical protein